MRTPHRRFMMCFVLAIAIALGLNHTYPNGQATIEIDTDDIGGTVRSAAGPEPGVWVIAETQDFNAVYRKIVVTNDDGHYVLPDLPDAQYDIWVRGYGLSDSGKLNGRPGVTLNLTVAAAATAQDAAKIYPANYWYSMLHIPDKKEFPGTGPSGNGISKKIKSQEQWMRLIKTDNCLTCHQMGNKATRELPESLANMESTVAAWERRIQSGQSGANMTEKVLGLGRKRLMGMYANWTDRIAAGELPKAWASTTWRAHYEDPSDRRITRAVAQTSYHRARGARAKRL